ncbi:inositol phosphorylceramide synthase [Cohnella pontilimi]|uniref:Inositol phosphorylceramide synthase n=1 Tax=Cohnella pontilimi TaxID=2564100 RepID=A0A4U0F9P1_9BACL|nr:phosphatase PAP2 family protein [Cohnella pontilimi]TJY41417.1 inositol phosphorylceramide synthase [Cohnella pontilimi]
MALFPSFASVQYYTVFVTVLLLWFGTGRQPLGAAYGFVRSLVISRKSLMFFAALIAILQVNKNELWFESKYGVQYDLTSVLTGWEGNWHAQLQRLFHSGFVTDITAFFYIVVFQSVMIASIGIYTYRKDMKLFYAFCVALLVNYIVAVPMYWFVPVNEAWYANPHIHFLMLEAFPTFETNYRGLSGLNNCFPSLHTSISVTMALIAARSGIRRWAVFAWVNAVVIIFSIFYLGIHWFTDMAAGLVLAWGSAAVGFKVGAWAERHRDASPAKSDNEIADVRI